MPVKSKPYEPGEAAKRFSAPAPGQSKKWFNETDPGPELWAHIKRLRAKQQWRRQADELALHLYSDMQYVGYNSAAGSATLAKVLDSRMGDNVIRPIVRTLDSKVARHRPRVVVMTDGAKWHEQQQAELGEKWIEGKFLQCRAEDELYPFWRSHALVIGTGCLRSYGTKENGAQLDVIPPWEIVVDDSEARYGSPRTIHFVRAVDRGVLAARYPERADVIMRTPPGAHAGREWLGGITAWDTEATSDVVLTVEAIHLPSSANANDGRHTIAVDTGWIYDSGWKRDHFPCAWLRRERRPAGLWGVGVPEDLAGLQLEMGRTSLALQEIIETLAVPFWLVEKGSKVVKSHISSLIGRVVEFTGGTPPQLVTPPAVPPDIWGWRQQLRQAAFESSGVSQLAAQMLKPAGLNSGKAIRAFEEIGAELIVDLLRAYENGVVRAAELLIEEQRELGESVKDQAVTVIGKGGIEKIKWSEFSLGPTQYVLKAVPASSLSNTYSGKIEDVYDLRDLGVLTDPDDIRDLLDIPDLKRQKRRTMSSRELLEKTIEWRIIKRGEFVQPEPTWNLKLAVMLGLQHINALQLFEDAPADRVELLRQFVVACKQLIEAGEPPPPEEMANGIPSAEPGPVPGLPPGPADIPEPGPGGPIGPAPIPGPGIQ